MILSPTLSKIASEYHGALPKLNLGNWLNFRVVALALCIAGISLFFISRCENVQVSTFFSSLGPPDIDPVSVIPDQAQVVMLGDKVEWQCKTKASAAHTVHWMKVRPIASSFFPPHACSWKNGSLPRAESICERLPAEIFLSFVFFLQHSQIRVFKTQTSSVLKTAAPHGSIFGLMFFWLDFEACGFFFCCNSLPFRLAC